MGTLADLPKEVQELIIKELLGANMFVVRLWDFKSLADTSRHWQGLVWKVYWECFHLEAKELYPTTRKEKWVKWWKPIEIPPDDEPRKTAPIEDSGESAEDKEAAEIALWIEML